MTVFSKFGVWDNEVKKLIDDICDKTIIERNELTEWLYNEAIIIFQTKQNTVYQSDVKTCQEKYKHRPIISPTYMLGQKLMGFEAILTELIDKFSNSNNYGNFLLKCTLTQIYNTFQITAIQNHLPFYTIQADISTQLNQFWDENPTTQPKEIFQFVIDKFQEYKIKKPELSQEIDDAILLMAEYAAHMRKKQQPTLQSNVNNSSAMFNASLEKNTSTTTSVTSIQNPNEETQSTFTKLSIQN